jgi:hypothetical protein
MYVCMCSQPVRAGTLQGRLVSILTSPVVLHVWSVTLQASVRVPANLFLNYVLVLHKTVDYYR